jgi:hypothetical protein
LQSAQRFIRRVERLPSIQLRLCGMKREGDVSGFEFHVATSTAITTRKRKDRNLKRKPETETGNGNSKPDVS